MEIESEWTAKRSRDNRKGPLGKGICEPRLASKKRTRTWGTGLSILCEVIGIDFLDIVGGDCGHADAVFDEQVSK